jgi:cobalt-zinc-cadmium resistance protein CzcA
MARTYGFALAGALLATFTITPVLASMLLPRHIREVETIVVRALRAAYSPALHWALTHRKTCVGFGVAFLALTGLLIPQLGTEFLPALEEGNLWIRASMPPTISLEAAMPAVTKMREMLLAHPEVITVVSQHGRPDNGSDAAGFFNAEFFVPLKPVDEWPSGMTKEKLVEDIQAEFAREFTGVGFNFSQYIQDNIEEGLVGGQRRQFGQDHWPRSGKTRRDRRADQARDGRNQRHRRPRHLPGPGAAQSQHQGRSR